MKRILIIDDDIHIGDMLQEVLIKQGYAVSRAYSGTEALLVLAAGRPDLVLLDLGLPGLPGERVLAEIRDIPVIVVSAKAEVDHKVELLLGGAADYVTKPFEMKELLARIAVGLRGARTAADAVLQLDGLQLNAAAHTVLVKEQPVKLTRTECAILKLLMQNPTQVITKTLLLERIGADTPDGTDNSLKTHVSNLRKKLRAIDGKDHIEAVWGIGFKWKAE